jgi:hypothetical protein
LELIDAVVEMKRRNPNGGCPRIVQQIALAFAERMQKTLTEMNAQLSNVLSDLSGASGMAIMHAILEGERDPWSLALDSVLIPYPQA